MLHIYIVVLSFNAGLRRGVCQSVKATFFYRKGYNRILRIIRLYIHILECAF